jgi:hypothetical protein
VPDEAVVAVRSGHAGPVADRLGRVRDAAVGDHFLQEVDAVVHLDLRGGLEFRQAFQRDEGGLGYTQELVFGRWTVADLGQARPDRVVEGDRVQPDAADAGEPRGQRDVRVQPVLIEIASAHPRSRLQRHDQGQAVGGRGRVVISPHRVLQSPVTRERVKLYAVQTVCS